MGPDILLSLNYFFHNSVLGKDLPYAYYAHTAMK